MGLFSEMLDENRILESLAAAEKILLISCPGCACESLSYSENLPCRSLTQSGDMEKSAVAVRMVRDRWDAKLKAAGKSLEHVTIAFPCEMFDTEREAILAKLADADTVAVLACSSAYIAIKDMLPGFAGRIVPMMKTAGTFVFRLVKDESGRNSQVDRGTARVLRGGH